MKLQAVIFDLDGVLADSEPRWNDIDAALLKEFGAEYNPADKQQVLGKSFPLAIQYYKQTYSLEPEIEALMRRRSEIAAVYYAEHIDIFAAAPAVLEALRRQGLQIGLATSSVSDFVIPFLTRHNLIGFFDQIVTGEEVKHGKPSPDIYLRAAQKLAIDPSHCLVVEDALAGIQAGKSAGMTVVGIPDPRFVDVAQYAGKADYLIGELAALPELASTLL